MNTDIIIALTGLIGIGLGALFSGLGYFLKIRSEQMKTKNTVLYHLLEIRHFIKSGYINPKELSEKYFIYCDDYFSRRGFDNKENIPKEINELIGSHFKAVTEAASLSLDTNFVNSFNESIFSLSKDHPVLAYMLRGRERVNKLLETQSNYLENLGNIISTNNTPDFIKKVALNHAKKLNDDAIGDLINEMDRDIRLVSRKSGLLSYISVRKILRDTKKYEVVINPETIDPIMDNFLAVVMEEVNKSSKRDNVTDTPS